MAAPALDPHLFLRHRPPCHGRLSCDLQAFRLPEFTAPLRDGLVALAVGVALVLVWRRLRRGRGETPYPPLAGALFTGAALAGYAETGHLVTGLALAAVFLAVGGALADALRVRGPFRMALALPGAWVLAERAAIPDPLWARLLAAGTVVVGAWAVADADRRLAPAGAGPVLLGVSLLGAYETVPDPDFALVLLAAAAPIVLLGWPVPLARLGGAGSAAATGLLAWAVAVGGRGRLSAVVGGVACLGLLAAEPVARLVDPLHRSALERAKRGRWILAVAFTQVALMVALTRVPAPERPAPTAAAMAGAELLETTTILLLAGWLWGVPRAPARSGSSTAGRTGTPR